MEIRYRYEIKADIVQNRLKLVKATSTKNTADVCPLRMYAQTEGRVTD
jgi:hypothetical protein